jgi:hypothetical protein
VHLARQHLQGDGRRLGHNGRQADYSAGRGATAITAVCGEVCGEGTVVGCIQSTDQKRLDIQPVIPIEISTDWNITD